MVLLLISQALLSDKPNYFPEVVCNWEKNEAENVFIYEVYLVYIKYFPLFFFFLSKRRCLRQMRESDILAEVKGGREGGGGEGRSQTIFH